MPYMYPTTTEYLTIEPELIQRGAAGRLGLQIMPVRGVRAAKVRWTQKDNYFGLQNLRGLDGRPTRINRVGQKTYEYEPGVFGEFYDITETELTQRSGSIDPNSVQVNVDDLVADADEILIGRELDRQESSVWTLLTTGTITILKDDVENGTQVGYSDQYPIQSYSALVPWTTIATATPILDFQSVVQLGTPAGISVDFSTGVAYMNSITANNLLNNTNAADLAGRRIGGGDTVNTLEDINRFFISRGLPKVQIYDGGYIPKATGTYQKFIPTGKVVVVGNRPSGARIGEYLLTINASAGYNPTSYRYVKDRANGTNAEKKTPANLEVHRGHNGGPVMYYPSAVIVITAFVP